MRRLVAAMVADPTQRQALCDAVVAVIMAITSEWTGETEDEGVDQTVR